MLGFLLFIIAVTLIAAFWRIFLGLALAALLVGGVGIAWIVHINSVPTDDQVRYGCTLSTRDQCVNAGYPNYGRPLTAEEKAAEEKRLGELARQQAQAAAERKKAEAEAEKQRQAAAAEAERQQQRQVLWQAFLQTPAGDYANRIIEQADQQVQFATLNGAANLQGIMELTYRKKSDLQALWQHYYTADFNRDGPCFTDISVSQSHACHPEWDARRIAERRQQQEEAREEAERTQLNVRDLKQKIQEIFEQSGTSVGH